MAEYMKEKIQVLRELGIPLSPAQLAHLKNLETEIQIDNFARDIILAPIKCGMVYS